MVPPPFSFKDFVILFPIYSHSMELCDDDQGLLQYVYEEISRNFDTITEEERVATVLRESSLCRKFRQWDPTVTERDAQCRTLTLMYLMAIRLQLP